ncbi:hypothetical protein [Asticcacaulis solisilvae]|uniref:hypothetical protein n=1 Tax=Asticcacaulis solisilvae TaxID=1217274 RepID=UPI003FD74766
MSTKTPNSVRWGGPGASHENARQPPEIDRHKADPPELHVSHVSGGGGEADRHHGHKAEYKKPSPRELSKFRS